ncbi:hypothetical protein LSUE1_G005522 [Lachnellula suecica]|uniref:BTB domain-containing protein n=1 Tax=Lachnellula suecica TaxID=602035 RepID=A0A8T9C0G5_9HELO|nr:hypothetical protein LSUE1_G005522 [Lachnellula suecica]
MESLGSLFWVDEFQPRKKPLKNWWVEFQGPRAELTCCRDPKDVVTIQAGNDETGKEVLIVHKAIACYYSAVFKAAFNSVFVEVATQVYTLEDVSPGLVRLLIHWLYHQEISIECKKATKSLADMQLVNLWLLADRLLIPSLQNNVIWKIERLRREHRAVSTSCLNHVHEHTLPHSPLRVLFLHQCAFNMVHSRFSEKPDHFPKEMLLELAKLLSVTVSRSLAGRKDARRDLTHFKVEEEDERRLGSSSHLKNVNNNQAANGTENEDSDDDGNMQG